MAGGSVPSRGRERSGAATSGPSARDLEEALRARVDMVVPKLLPRARIHQIGGAYWECGSVAGEQGSQMKINRSGGRQGLWTDFSAPQGTDEYSGDMLQLVAAVLFGGWSSDSGKKNAIAWAKSELGYDDLDPARLATIRAETRVRSEEASAAAAEQEAQRRDSAYAMWRGAVPIAGTAAEKYLDARGIGPSVLGKYPGSFRFLPDAWCQVRRGKYPAMIAQIIGLDGRFRAVHRTYLDVSAGKMGPVTNFKLPPDAKGRRKSHKLTLGLYKGGHLPLWKGASAATLREIPKGTPVYVSEGIEDGLTVALAMPDARVIAGVALSNMGGLELPPQAGPLIFIGQLDPIGGKALEAFEGCVKRQQEAGREVKIIWPQPGFKDFNDQLRGLRIAEAGA